MKIKVLGGDGRGLLSDVTVWLVGLPNSQSATILSTAFPSRIQKREDGSIALPIEPGPTGLPSIVDAVEIESPTVTILMIVSLVVVLFAIFKIVRR